MKATDIYSGFFLQLPTEKKICTFVVMSVMFVCVWVYIENIYYKVIKFVRV